MIQKEIKSFGCAFNGIGRLLHGEVHARIHIAAILVVTAAGFLFNISPIEWCILILTMALVLALEAVNSAIERACDVAWPTYHPAIKEAKDMAAAAVLIAAIGAITVGMVIFLPKLYTLCNGYFWCF